MGKADGKVKNVTLYIPKGVTREHSIDLKQCPYIRDMKDNIMGAHAHRHTRTHATMICTRTHTL